MIYFTAGPIGGPPEALGVSFEVKVYYTLPPFTRALTMIKPLSLIHNIISFLIISIYLILNPSYTF
ncbi:MAG: hypothetical protein EU535_08425 [Promethearchaeota archaeon]|nr:MAG: hypothetical protein EU535_08425 [Candidatus Lokiarchaeota archaeon]